MNKHDWVFVGVRLLGVFFLVQVALEVPRFFASLLDWDLGFWAIVQFGASGLVALVLALRTDDFCAWLGAPRGDRAKRSPTSSSDQQVP